MQIKVEQSIFFGSHNKRIGGHTKGHIRKGKRNIPMV